MKKPSIRHSDALLIAWRLAELEATNLGQDELEPVHFFLGLLKLVELNVQAILGDQSTLASERIQQEANRVSRLSECFRAAGIETTSARRKLRRTLPRGGLISRRDNMSVEVLSPDKSSLTRREW